jgi:three-Cys-motif partner protein
MAKPSDILWEYKRHTAAKHEILSRYLDAWIPILGFGHPRLVLIDGFAGPGRYRGGEAGSPLIMLDAFLRRKDRDRIKAKLRFVFIEEHIGRFRHLESELEKRSWPTDRVDVVPIHGRFEEKFPEVIEALRDPRGQLPPTFAFIDPFGADQTRPELHGRLLGLPRCEALIYLPVTHLARFVREPDLEATLNNLYRGSEWKEARKPDDIASRKKILHDLFRAQLEGSSRWVRSFEIVPQAGGNSYYLFFGTGNEQGLRKMKASMWSIDPVAGQAFRDSTMVDHPVLFQEKPDLSELLRLLRERFGDREFTIDEASWFTLTDTPFRDDAHLKRPTLAPAEKSGILEVARPPGSRSGFVSGTRLRFRPGDR